MERAPLVRIWRHRPDGTSEHDSTIENDLEELKSAEESKGPFRLRYHAFRLDTLKNLDQAPVSAGEPMYRLSIDGRDSPLRAFSFQDESNLSDYFVVRHTTHLPDASMEKLNQLPQTK